MYTNDFGLSVFSNDYSRMYRASKNVTWNYMYVSLTGCLVPKCTHVQVPKMYIDIIPF